MRRRSGKKRVEVVSFERQREREGYPVFLVPWSGLVWSGLSIRTRLAESRTYWVVVDRQKRATGLAYTAADNAHVVSEWIITTRDYKRRQATKN